EGINEGVAPREDDLLLAVDDGESGVGPLPLDDVVAGVILLPNELATKLAEGDEAGGLGGGDLALFIDAVAGDDHDWIADDELRAIAEVVRDDVEFLHHVVGPLHLAGRVGTDDLAAWRGVVQAFTLDDRRGAEPLAHGPLEERGVIGVAMDDLPEELAVSFTE